MVGKGNQNVYLIQIDASSFAEFELSEFEIARVDCIYCTYKSMQLHYHNLNIAYCNTIVSLSCFIEQPMFSIFFYQSIKSERVSEFYCTCL